MKKLFRFLRFSLSSFASFVVDYAIANALFYWVGLDTLPSVVFARVASSLCNFFINQKLVFRSGNSRRHILRYYLVALLVLGLNYGLVELMAYLGIPFALAKMIADITLFFCSYFLQRWFVFPASHLPKANE